MNSDVKTYNVFQITKITRNGLSLNFYIDKIDKSEIEGLTKYIPKIRKPNEIYIKDLEEDDKHSVAKDGKVVYHVIFDEKGSFCLKKYSKYGLYITCVKEKKDDVLLDFNYPLKVIKYDINIPGIFNLIDGSVLSYTCKDCVYEFKYDDKIIFSQYEPTKFHLFQKKYKSVELCVSLCSMNSEYPQLDMFGDKVYADGTIIETRPAQRHYFVAEECVNDVINELQKQGFKRGNCPTTLW